MRSVGSVAGASVTASASPTARLSPPEKININTASAAELDALPGIGAVYSQRIVDSRQSARAVRQHRRAGRAQGHPDRDLRQDQGLDNGGDALTLAYLRRRLVLRDRCRRSWLGRAVDGWRGRQPSASSPSSPTLFADDPRWRCSSSLCGGLFAGAFFRFEASGTPSTHRPASPPSTTARRSRSGASSQTIRRSTAAPSRRGCA